jgi:hypothetical protein
MGVTAVKAVIGVLAVSREGVAQFFEGEEIDDIYQTDDGGFFSMSTDDTTQLKWELFCAKHLVPNTKIKVLIKTELCELDE